jgi:hypothetical protein
MNFHENSRTSRAATKNLARSEFRFTGGSIVLDDIGEKPSSLVESHEVARPSADFPFNFLVSPGSAVTGPFCPERNGEFPPRGTAAPASSLPSRIPPAPSLAGARRGSPTRATMGPVRAAALRSWQRLVEGRVTDDIEVAHSRRRQRTCPWRDK